MCCEQAVLYSRQVATGLPSKWPLRAASSGAHCCTLKLQSCRKSYTTFLIQNFLAQQTFSLLLLPVAHPVNSLNSEFNLQIMALCFQPLGSWHYPAGMPFPAASWPGGPHSTKPHSWWLGLLWCFLCLKSSNRCLAYLFHWTGACRHNEHLEQEIAAYCRWGGP